MPLVVVTAVPAVLLWAHVTGANGPAEWRWPYREPGVVAAPFAAALALASLLVVAVLAVRDVGEPPRPRGVERLTLFASILAGAALTLTLVAAAPDGFRWLTRALVSRDDLGFVWDEGLAPDAGELLADYPEVSRGLNQHSLTHPPGPLLAVRLLDQLCDRLPPPPSLSSLPALAESSAESELTHAHNHHRRAPRALAGPWTLTVLALMLPGLSALAAWPLFRLALALDLGERTALVAALLWLLVPARSFFTPSLDQALPALLLGAAALAARGGEVRALAAGCLLWLACFLSYGCLALLPLAAVLAWTAPAGPGGRAGWCRATLFGIGFAAPWVALFLTTGFDPFATLRAALAHHDAIAVRTRGYWTWLLWNPYDFALLLGPAVLLLAAAYTLTRTEAGADPSPERPGRVRAAAWCFWALLLLGWISGRVRGEVGRIWLPWMPLACLFAARATTARAWRRSGLAGLLALQAALTTSEAANLFFTF